MTLGGPLKVRSGARRLVRRACPERATRSWGPPTASTIGSTVPAIETTRLGVPVGGAPHSSPPLIPTSSDAITAVSSRRVSMSFSLWTAPHLGAVLRGLGAVAGSPVPWSWSWPHGLPPPAARVVAPPAREPPSGQYLHPGVALRPP